MSTDITLDMVMVNIMDVLANQLTILIFLMNTGRSVKDDFLEIPDIFQNIQEEMAL